MSSQIAIMWIHRIPSELWYSTDTGLDPTLKFIALWHIGRRLNMSQPAVGCKIPLHVDITQSLSLSCRRM